MLFSEICHLHAKQTAFDFNCVLNSPIEDLAMGSLLSPLLCDIYMQSFEENFLMHINFLIGLRMWMVLSLLFIPVFTFLVCSLQLIWLFQSIHFWSWKQLSFLSALIGSHQLLSENPTQSVSFLMLFLISQQKIAEKKLMFIVLYTFALILLMCPMNLTT